MTVSLTDPHLDATRPVEAGVDRQQALAVVLITAGIWLATLGPVAALSDRIGRRPVLLTGAAAMALWSAAYFPLIDTRSVPLILLAFAVMALTFSATYGPQAALFSELFKTRVRYSGASLGYQLGAILGGGLAPFIATGLYAATGTSLAITAYMLLVALISLGCIAAISETSRRDLADPYADTASVNPLAAPAAGGLAEHAHHG